MSGERDRTVLPRDYGLYKGRKDNRIHETLDVDGSNSHEWHFLLCLLVCIYFVNITMLMFDNRLNLLPQPVVTL